MKPVGVLIFLVGLLALLFALHVTADAEAQGIQIEVVSNGD